MSQKLKQLKEKLRNAIKQELVEYDNLNTQKEDEIEERLNLFLEKNTPTNPSKWSYYKSQAKKKFDVYPSAYANGWAAKQYKAAGGGWKTSENIEEVSMTGNIDGGEGPPKTPYAFQSKKKRGQDKKKEDEISTNSTGFVKMNEGRYHDWRNDESITPKQKIGRSMREVRDSLNGLSKTIDMSVKLKTELKVDSKDYWKTTNKALTKISERLVKLANKVGRLQ